MSKVKTITIEEAGKLLQHLLGGHPLEGLPRKNARNYTMAVLMLDAGLRVGEVVQMKVGDFVIAGEICRSVTIRKEAAKNNVERTIPLTDRISSALMTMLILFWKYHKIQTDDFAFYNLNCRIAITARQVERIILEAGVNSIGRAITPHTLRHTFATRLAKKVSLRTVQMLLGHKSITSTQVYTHPDQDDAQKAIDNLNGLPVNKTVK